MKTEEYINSLIKEKEHLTELCKSHVKTILLIKRELGKLKSTITQKDKKIQKLENESLNTKIEKELNEIKNELNIIKIKYNDLKIVHDTLNDKYNTLEKKYNDVVFENSELKRIFDEIETLCDSDQ